MTGGRPYEPWELHLSLAAALDLEAIDELETALRAYEGTAVVVSHDRNFLEAFAPTRSISP